jgi:hypothetical protein
MQTERCVANNKYYILDKNNQPLRVASVVEWENWFQEIDNRRIAYDELFVSPSQKIIVSTVFVGRNRGHEDKPKFFETMVTGLKHEDYTMRYANFEEAKKGHAKLLKFVKEKML